MRKIAISALVLTTGLLLAGCSGGDSDENASGTVVEEGTATNGGSGSSQPNNPAPSVEAPEEEPVESNSGDVASVITTLDTVGSGDPSIYGEEIQATIERGNSYAEDPEAAASEAGVGTLDEQLGAIGYTFDPETVVIDGETAEAGAIIPEGAAVGTTTFMLSYVDESWVINDVVADDGQGGQVSLVDSINQAYDAFDEAQNQEAPEEAPEGAPEE